MAESSNISVTGIGPVKPEQAAPLFLMRDPVIFPYSLTPLLVDEENLAALRQRILLLCRFRLCCIRQCRSCWQ